MNPDAKVRSLRWILWKSYYEERWISMEEIIEHTKMSSFNQRIQTMREAGIKIENKMEGNNSFYRMFTDPQSIDWDTLKPVIPRQRKQRHGRKAEKVPEEQGRLL